MYFPMAMPGYQVPPRAGHCEFLEIDEDELDTSNLHARLIIPPTRQRLLFSRSSRSSHLSDSDIDAEALLVDLGRLAPSVAKDFVPKASAQENLPFRVLNDVDFEGEEESYIAMSYVWKKVNRDAPRKMVSPLGDLPFGWVRTVEQFPLPTSKGMFVGLLNERKEGEGVWFDQVCIKQEDEAEKAIAIGAMDTIYKNARTVVVALDDIAATEDELLFLQQYVRQYAFSEAPLNQVPNRGANPPFMQQHALFRSFFDRVLSSIWFERAWCANEMRMGRSHVFLVPCVAHDADEGMYTLIRFTSAFFLHMLVLAGELVTITPSQQAQIRSLLEHFGRKSLMDERAAFAVRHPGSELPSLPGSVSFVPTIAEIFRMKAGGNPKFPEYLRRLDANRDKTSIALNLAGLPLVLKPASPLQRPTIEDECLRQLLLVGLAAQDPVTLCTTGAPLQLHDGSISWLCRPTQLDLQSTHGGPPPRFTKVANPITQASDGRAEYVQLDLVFLDLPHRAQPNPHFPGHVQRAREFIDTCIQYQVQSHTFWNMWQAPNHPRAPAMRNIFIQTLACIFDCGPHWLLDIVSQLPTPTAQPLIPDPQVLTTLFNPQLPLNSYIHHPATLPTLSTLLNILSVIITHGIPWASTATERTHGPLIITAPPASPYLSPHSTSSFTPPSNATTSGNGKALVFAPFEHSKTLLVAIPAAVKNEAYKGLARGWILTPSNPYTGSPRGIVSWELKGKGVVLGDAVFGGGVVGAGGGARCHRVYGPGTGVTV